MTIRIFSILALATLLLSACTNTRAGISKDAENTSTKIQRTSEIWTQ